MRIDIDDNEMYMVLSTDYLQELNIITAELTAEIPDAYILKRMSSIRNTERKFVSDTGLVPVGLWVNMLTICKNHNINVQFSDRMSAYINKFQLDFEEFKKYVENLFDGAKNKAGKPFMPYEYQVYAAYMLLKYRKCCGELSTSAGKTLISFIIFKYLFDVEKVKKILYIVPNVDLADQSAEKYQEYEDCLKKHSHNWEAGILRGGLTKKEKERVESCNILFGTFQSLSKRKSEFFIDFTACVNDECLDKNTMVRMADGMEKRICEVYEGNEVFTYNRLTGEKEVHEVEFVYKGLSKGNKQFDVELENGKHLLITGNHKVLTDSGLWKRTDELNGDENLVEFGEDDVKVLRIKTLTKMGIADEEVYNLRIKDDSEECHNYFANGVCVSNCHHSSANSIKNILTKCVNLEYSIGVTGTFPKEKTYENFIIQSFIGPLVHKFTADDLINKEKRGTPIYVTFQYLNWGTHEEKKSLWKMRSNKDETDISAGSKVLREEQKFINSSYTRLKYIGDLAISTKKNTLVLFGDVKGGYGKRLYDYIKNNSPKDVYYVDGGTKSENREWMKQQMEEDETGNTVMVASIGTMGEGIDLKNLWCIFLVNTAKSERIIRQICGRGLRLFEGKTKVVLIDFVDDLRYSEDGHQYNNYMWRHYKERRKIYLEQKFPVYEQKINFDNQNTLL